MNGAGVEFSVKAYPSQVATAGRIMISLQRSQNDLLVSLSWLALAVRGPGLAGFLDRPERSSC